MDPPRARPPIFKIALSFLALLVYRAWMVYKRKTDEIRLWEFEWDSPCRVRMCMGNVAWRAVARRGVAWRGVARRGMAWRGEARRGAAWH